MLIDRIAAEPLHSPLRLAPAPKPSTPVLALDSFSQSNFVTGLKAALERLGYDKGSVYLRHFDAKRIPLALETGTDRSHDSLDWQWPKFDNTARPPLEDGAKITYAVPFTYEAQEQPSEGMDSLWWEGGRVGAPGKAVEVYDWEGLQQAPGSLAEYEFLKPPAEALLMVVVPSESALARTEAQALMRLGRSVEAGVKFRQAIAAGDPSFGVQAGLGSSLMLQGDVGEALTSFQAALAVAQNDRERASSLFSIASAQASLGNLVAARQSLDAAVDRGFSHPESLKAAPALLDLYNPNDREALLERVGLHR